MNPMIASINRADRPLRSARRSRTWRCISTGLFLITVVGSWAITREWLRTRADEQRLAAQHTLTEIAGSLRISLQRQQDLANSARAFIVINPAATSQQFSRWAQLADLGDEHPEVTGIGMVAFVPRDRINAFTASMLAARDSGQAQVFTSDTLFDHAALIVQSPVYRDGLIPSTVASRQAGFVGTITTLTEPELLLRHVLARYPVQGMELHYDEGPTHLTFGTTPAANSGRRLERTLGDGWTVATFNATATESAFSHDVSRSILVVGMIIGALLSALVYVLAMSRSRAIMIVADQTDALRHQACHDSLTGLSNRAVVLQRVEQLLEETRHAQLVPGALYIDLDGFKMINDTFGHHVGDELLLAASTRLRNAFRCAHTIGRMGGDEFVILIGASTARDCDRAAERLLDVMREPFALQIDQATRHVFLTASIGVAHGSRTNGTELLRDADLAMYYAKQDSADRYLTYEPVMHQLMSRRQALEVELHGALERHEFALQYQPIYGLTDLEVIGAEALLRWHHPLLGIIQPDDFIPILERTGQIIEIGRWVLINACQQAASWAASGRPIGISVNVSARQLDRASILVDIADALDRSGLDPALLTIEITESELVRHPANTRALLFDIRASGVRISVDDFGTGYSSLAYIHQFAIDCIKIDRRFTQAIGTSPESDALIRTLVRLAQDLGIDTVAEGVETIDQLDQLRDAHVTNAQGYLLSHPLDAKTVTSNILQSPINTPIRVQHDGGSRFTEGNADHVEPA